MITIYKVAMNRMNQSFLILLILGLVFFTPIKSFSDQGEKAVAAKGVFIGTLKIEYVSVSNADIYDFEIHIDPPVWELSLRAKNPQKNRIQNARAFGRQDQVMYVVYHQEDREDRNRNTASVRVFDGTRPFDLRDLEHVWIALLSGDFFIRDDDTFPWVDSVGLCMREPSIITDVLFEENSVSPSYVKWYDERSHRAEPNGAPRFVGEFKALALDRTIGGLTYAASSELIIGRPSGEQDIAPITRSTLVVEEVSSLVADPRLAPDLDGRVMVMDFRFGDRQDRRSVQYNISDGEVPMRGSPIIMDAIAQQHPGLLEDQGFGKRRLLILIILGLSTLGFLMLPIFLKGRGP